MLSAAVVLPDPRWRSGAHNAVLNVVVVAAGLCWRC